MEDNDIMEMKALLITWRNAFEAPPPSADAPATEGGLPTNQASEGLFTDREPARGSNNI